MSDEHGWYEAEVAKMLREDVGYSPTSEEVYSLFTNERNEWPHAPRDGDPRFLAFVDQMEQTHARKQKDYGTDTDPFANVRAGEDLGIPGWVSAVVRMNDKMRRLNKAARQVLAKEEVSMEFDGPLDDLLDMAVYAGIATVLYKETEPTPYVPGEAPALKGHDRFA